MERGAAVKPLAAATSVALFAPGGYDPDPERALRAQRYFEARGHRFAATVAGDARYQRFAGTDAERLSELHRVMADPATDLAMALRGGYGVTRLLPQVDYPALARSIEGGKRLVAHSDFTGIHLALLAQTGAISFAGPMASFDFGGTEVDAFMEEHFWRAMDEGRVDATFETDSAPLHASGVLWGGNLSMLVSLIGTPWMPRVDGGVLFVEDINERPYRIERMLLQLQQAGILDRQRAVLCGDFSGFRPVDYDNGYGIADALDYVSDVTTTPLIRGLPFGHVPRKLTLAVGAMAEVRVVGGRCRLVQDWSQRFGT